MASFKNSLSSDPHLCTFCFSFCSDFKKERTASTPSGPCRLLHLSPPRHLLDLCLKLRLQPPEGSEFLRRALAILSALMELVVNGPGVWCFFPLYLNDFLRLVRCPQRYSKEGQTPPSSLPTGCPPPTPQPTTEPNISAVPALTQSAGLLDARLFV